MSPYCGGPGACLPPILAAKETPTIEDFADAFNEEAHDRKDATAERTLPAPVLRRIMATRIRSVPEEKGNAR
jgi:hypothetical protein